MKKPKNITCLKCGWISFAVTKAYAEAEIKKFIDLYNSCDDKGKAFWDGIGSNGERIPRKMPTLADYGCFCCGHGKFRPTTEEEMKSAYGCTISGAIYEEA